MEARPVDPRDTTWEHAVPTYRVYFFKDPGHGGWPSYEYELVDAEDVGEVLRWAEEHADGRVYVVHAVWDDSRLGKGLLTLTGYNPNWPEDPRRPQA